MFLTKDSYVAYEAKIQSNIESFEKCVLDTNQSKGVFEKLALQSIKFKDIPHKVYLFSYDVIYGYKISSPNDLQEFGTLVLTSLESDDIQVSYNSKFPSSGKVNLDKDNMVLLVQACAKDKLLSDQYYTTSVKKAVF